MGTVISGLGSGATALGALLLSCSPEPNTAIWGMGAECAH